MFFIIHCGGMPFDGETIYKSSLGGSETAAYYMAKELVRKGHRVIVYTNMTGEDRKIEGVEYKSAGPITERTPLGVNFTEYASTQKHDVCIIQRHPMAFNFPVASRVNLLWLHDLALYRTKVQMIQHLWNIDNIMVVSEYHKEQVVEVYGFNPDNVIVTRNGVDLTLFANEIPDEAKVDPESEDQFRMIYTSRPERGLENLVGPGGIMEQLLQVDSKYHLYVCRYDNTTPQMKPYYDMLDSRVMQLPNCTMLGTLNKQDLAYVMRQCHLHVYPTEFEEVSCITAMECMAAGLPQVTSKHAALPETCNGSGAKLIPLRKGKVDIPAFIAAVKERKKNKNLWQKERDLQFAAAHDKSWEISAEMLVDDIRETISQVSDVSKVKEMWRNSDIIALQRWFYDRGSNEENAIEQYVVDDLAQSYQFTVDEDWSDHYAKYYAAELERGVKYGPERLDGNGRFEQVLNQIMTYLQERNPDEGPVTILDYGCAHGHYTLNLAKRLPEVKFFGVDIEASNIKTAIDWGIEEGIKNAIFTTGQVMNGQLETVGHPDYDPKQYDVIIAAEVVEHVKDPMELVKTLHKYLKPGGKMIITVPYGPWESQGYFTFTKLGMEHDLRAHVYHFDRDDLKDMFGKCNTFRIGTVPAGTTPEGDLIGSYLVTFIQDDEQPFGEIDYERKFEMIVPKQTVSCCMIVKDGALTLGKTLESVGPYMDEIIIGIDETTTDHTESVIDHFVDSHPETTVTIFSIPKVLDIGFDAARNLTVESASGDWIFWIDADETLVHGHNLRKYLRNNMFNGYCVKQHHFAIEPLGLLKTDFPCRLFRNHTGVQFSGVVHEHPLLDEKRGVGHATMILDIDIGHNSYVSEQVRRERFKRNIPLMVRDREENPNRILGKALWIRDLAQMCQYEMELTGGQMSEGIRNRVLQGLQVWEELLDNEDVSNRMLIDFLQYYSMLVRIRSSRESFDYTLIHSSDKFTVGDKVFKEKPVNGYFLNQQHLLKFIKRLIKENTRDYSSRYF